MPLLSSFGLPFGLIFLTMKNSNLRSLALMFDTFSHIDINSTHFNVDWPYSSKWQTHKPKHQKKLRPEGSQDIWYSDQS